MLPETKGFGKKELHREPTKSKAFYFFSSDPSELPPTLKELYRGESKEKELDRWHINCALLNLTPSQPRGMRGKA